MHEKQQELKATNQERRDAISSDHAGGTVAKFIKTEDQIHADFAQREAEIRRKHKENDPYHKSYQNKVKQAHARREQVEKNAAAAHQVPLSEKQRAEEENITAMAKARTNMDAQQQAMMLNAAMRSPVRSGLEESFNMINDELMRVGEAQRLGLSLGGDSATEKESMAVAISTFSDEIKEQQSLLQQQVDSLRKIETAFTHGNVLMQLK